MRVLMILVPDHDPTPRHLRLERFVAPYYAFRGAGVEVAIASPDGGVVFDRSSPLEGVTPSLSGRFAADREVRDSLLDTLRLDQVFPEDFAAAFCIGASGPFWADGDVDAAPTTVGAMLARFLAAGKPVVAYPSPPSLSPRGAGGGLLIAADAAGTSEAAAHALLAALGAPSSADLRAHRDELLNEALTESFPASDPITRFDFR